MPNYDLKCKSCNTEHKLWATIAQKSNHEIKCPSCGSYAMETLFKSAPAHVKNVAPAGCPSASRCGGCAH